MNTTSSKLAAQRGKLLRTVVVFAGAAAIVFVGVTITQINYVSSHPYGYGPAKIIAWGAGAGAVLAVAVALLAYALRLGD